MRDHRQNIFPRRLVAIGIALPAMALFVSMAGWGETTPPKPAGSPSAEGAPAASQTNGHQLQLDSPAPPNTDLSDQPDFDFFAWNSFIAMNWPALDPENYNYQRGFPDLTKSFVDAAPDDLTVWETFKEKREVFNFPALAAEFPGNAQALPPWNYKLDYGPVRTAEDETFEDSYDTSMRIMPTTAQQHPYDSFDETIEVVSEALEPFYADGTTPNPIGPVPGVRSGRPVGPRVWRGTPSPQSAVFYEVKVNYDYYRYVKEHNYNVAMASPMGLDNDNTKRDAKQGVIAFPYRTSAVAGPKRQSSQPKHQIVVGYSAEATKKEYAKVTPESNMTPPPVGSIQIKVGWVILTPEEAASGRYHTATAQYFSTESDDDGNPVTVANQGIFGLVGIHIIQRIHTGSSDESGDATGGTFVFATFEHVDNDKAGFTYSNYYDPLNDPAYPKDGKPPYPPELPLDPGTGKPWQAGFYPPLEKPFGPYLVKRKFQPISQQSPKPLGTKEVNEVVWDVIRKKNPKSVWLNYRLIGTQFRAVNVTDVARQVRPGQPPQQDYPPTRYPVTEYDPTGIGQPLYLANLVIETNADLQLFQGIPPGVPTIDKYQGVGVMPNTTFNYDRAGNNMSFARSPYNMGGCMACHGVAQSLGFSFSFVLKGGYPGATTDTQSHFDIAGATHQEPDDN